VIYDLGIQIVLNWQGKPCYDLVEIPPTQAMVAHMVKLIDDEKLSYYGQAMIDILNEVVVKKIKLAKQKAEADAKRAAEEAEKEKASLSTTAAAPSNSVVAPRPPLFRQGSRTARNLVPSSSHGNNNNSEDGLSPSPQATRPPLPRKGTLESVDGDDTMDGAVPTSAQQQRRASMDPTLTISTSMALLAGIPTLSSDSRSASTSQLLITPSYASSGTYAPISASDSSTPIASDATYRMVLPPHDPPSGMMAGHLSIDTALVRHSNQSNAPLTTDSNTSSTDFQSAMHSGGATPMMIASSPNVPTSPTSSFRQYAQLGGSHGHLMPPSTSTHTNNDITTIISPNEATKTSVVVADSTTSPP
jgi:hypothetical protein